MEAEIISTFHDEIILEIPERMAHDAAEILRETTAEAGKAFPVSVHPETTQNVGERFIPSQILSESTQIRAGVKPAPANESTNRGFPHGH